MILDRIQQVEHDFDEVVKLILQFLWTLCQDPLPFNVASPDEISETSDESALAIAVSLINQLLGPETSVLAPLSPLEERMMKRFFDAKAM